MDELSINESTIRDVRCLNCEERKPLITAESGEKLGIGVSLSDILSPTFVKPEEYEWYVMRATYGRAEKAVAMVMERDVERCADHGSAIFAITPHETRRKFEGETRSYEQVACMPSMFFMLARKEDAMQYANRSKGRYSIDFVDFCFDHTQKNEHGRDIQMRIPHNQMVNFLRVTEVKNPQAFVIRDEECNFKPGGYVRIIHGIFEGAIGRVARISQQTRVIVTLENVMQYATSYIPKSFMQAMTDEETEAFLNTK